MIRIRFLIYVLIICFRFCSGTGYLHAQTDTTILDHFYVLAKPNGEFADFRSERLDSLQIVATRGGSLADLLSLSSAVVLRHYGPGQLASASIRGASASQTMLIWNGIRINNPMMMQSDVSMLPLAIVGEGTIVYGSGTLGYASGVFGGVIDIRSDMSIGSMEPGVTVEKIVGSFGYNAFNAKMDIHQERFIGKTIFYREASDNDYSYPDNFTSVKPWDIAKRKNASWFHHGVVQHIGFGQSSKLTGNVLIWAQQKQHNVPYPIHQPQDKYKQSQSDEALRLIANGSMRLGKIVLDVQSGYQHGSMHYIESRSLTDARHFTNNIQQMVTIKGFNSKIRWRATADYEMQWIETTAYMIRRIRHIIAGYGEIWNGDSGNFTYGLQSRVELVPGYGLSVIPSGVAGFRAGRTGSNQIKLTMMRNRQLPGFNDLYWVPGGNPEINPEKGYGAELSYERMEMTLGSVTLMPKVALFRQRINDKISWMPDTGALWSAFNIGLVKISGLEASLKAGVSVNRYRIQSTISYQYISASRWSDDGEPVVLQLVYQPFHTSSAIILLMMPAGNFIWESSYTGSRFTNSDNSSYLPSHFISNLKYMSPVFRKSFLTGELFFSINNILDAKYQVIAWYPMPGRYFKTGVNLKFNYLSK